MLTHNEVSQSLLGKKTAYEECYNPDLLFPIARKSKRDEIGVPTPLPFFGFDLWNHYEVSWLNEKGKPQAAMAELQYACDSSHIIESKSMKLYFNSFNNTQFKDTADVEARIQKDIEKRVGGRVFIKISPLSLGHKGQWSGEFQGFCLDELDIDCSIYTIHPDYLRTENEKVDEVLYSNLLKSNCLVTKQPDWGSVQIAYKGRKINREGLLKYIVSFRNHNEFHEQCIERIFMDMMRRCQPEELTVYGRYTRRGGIDINPFRSSNKAFAVNRLRLVRQ